MIRELTTRVQTPDEGFDWLYKDIKENERMFRKEVGLPDGATLWDQCTDEEKVEWEESHKPEPDPSPEPEPEPDSEQPEEEERSES